MRKRGRRLERAVEMMTSPSMRPVAGRTAAGPAAAFDAVGNAGDTGSSAISPTRASAYEWRDDNTDTPVPRREDEPTAEGGGAPGHLRRARERGGTSELRSSGYHLGVCSCSLAGSSLLTA